MVSSKKIVACCAVLLVFSLRLSAQSFSFSFGDLFGQASKQQKNYELQLVALQAFESELKQGYGVIKNGLSDIAAINTSELNAHTAYYQSLKQPSSALKNNPQVQDILNWLNEITSTFGQSFSGLTDDEQSYIALVKAQVFRDCNADLNDLQNLLTSGQLSMKDDERLKRLDKIHSAMLDKYEFTRSFCNSVKLLAAQRQQDSNDTQTLKSIYETN